jgi:hypothetical protein
MAFESAEDLLEILVLSLVRKVQVVVFLVWITEEMKRVDCSRYNDSYAAFWNNYRCHGRWSLRNDRSCGIVVGSLALIGCCSNSDNSIGVSSSIRHCGIRSLEIAIGFLTRHHRYLGQSVHVILLRIYLVCIVEVEE